MCGSIKLCRKKKKLARKIIFLGREMKKFARKIIYL